MPAPSAIRGQGLVGGHGAEYTEGIARTVSEWFTRRLTGPEPRPHADGNPLGILRVAHAIRRAEHRRRRGDRVPHCARARQPPRDRRDLLAPARSPRGGGDRRPPRPPRGTRNAVLAVRLRIASRTLPA